jgi:enoyl-CoA hydratase
MSELIRLESATVAHLTFANPPLNLVTRELLEELSAALDTLEGATPGDVRVVVVTGEGDRAFSAGSHVGEFESQRGPNGRERHALESGVADRLARLPMPTIAAIEGNALGGGLELALCCDIRVASESSRLGLPEVRLAVTPGAGGTQRLPRVVGPARAKELILTGRVLTAEEAERIGLVSRVVPTGQALAVADEIAAEIAARGPIAVREAKQLIDLATDADLATGLAAELDASDRVFATDDMVEGAQSFFAKREPQYRGR